MTLLIIQFYCVSWNMVLGASVINGSPLIYLDESKRLKLGLIFLNPKKFFVVFHRVPNWALFCFFYMLMISITLLTNLDKKLLTKTSDKNLRSLEHTVNIELINVCNWLTANKLSLNVKKSNFVIFRPYQNKLPKHSFKKKITEYLFQIFLKQDSYVDIHMLINEMKKLTFIFITKCL